jgi:hypothetical protein
MGSPSLYFTIYQRFCEFLHMTKEKKRALWAKALSFKVL